MTGEIEKSYCGNYVTGKQCLLMTSLSKFFNEANMSLILPILKGKVGISLRIIDWFVTNYAKKNNVIYYIPIYRKKEADINSNKKKTLKKNKKDELVCVKQDQFIVYLNYKSQLKAYSKKQFDPFCRRDRIEFYYGKNNKIVTTVGQLNFFRWALENKVLDYIENNLKTIEEDMNINIRKSYPKIKCKSKKKSPMSGGVSEKKERKKRKELSVCATKLLNKHAVNIVVEFE